MAKRCTVCLIGPKSAGKSSLLQTFMDCIDLNGHGFSSEYKIHVQDINEEDYTGGGSVTRILGGSSRAYSEFRNRFFVNQEQTDDTYDYFFRLTADGIGDASEPGENSANYMLLRVVDSAGEYAVDMNHYGGSEARIENPVDSVNKLNDALMQADAVVVVIPLVDMERATFTGPLTTLISKLVNAGGERPYRIVVAFTQYEKLFVRVGRDAFMVASFPEIARSIMQRAINQGRWADNLKRFASLPNRKVYFTVTSSYGFAKGLGIPNIDPHWVSADSKLSEQLFGKPNNIAAFWRPFLTADPFITAAIDKPGEFTFTFDGLDSPTYPGANGRPPPGDTGRDPQPPNPPRWPPRDASWFRGPLDWLNKQRDE